MKTIVRCPQCKKDALYSTENVYRPFCSERCQLLDLGDWADGKYAIPAEDSDDSDGTASASEGSESDDDDGSLRQ